MKSLDAIFKPSSIAVVGASSKDKSIGKEIVRNLVDYEFQGTVFPVNPKAKVVYSIKCYSDVTEIPDAVDLAIVVVPSRGVLDVAEACGKRGIKGLVVISAGFRETGEEGREREARLLDILKKYDMRMIGPNCMGVINTHPDVRMDATFAPTPPLAGRVGFMSQSGALGVAILDIAKNIGLGISMFVSMGNKTDVSGNDLLKYWGDDDDTHLILMYLESFGNPRKFTQIARRVSKRKPILCVKSGRTVQGATAASSHTGALASSLDVAVDALLEKCGVVRVATIDELFNLAIAFDAQPLPPGSRVAIVTNAGGPAIMATDAIVNAGMQLASLTEKTKERLRAFLPAEASVHNPVDMIASANEISYRQALQWVLQDDNVDAVLVIFVPPIMINASAVADAIVEVNERYKNKTVLACFMAQREAMDAIEQLRAGRIPVYSFPEPAVQALAAMHQYRCWRDKPDSLPPEFDVDRDRVRTIISEQQTAGRDYLDWDATHAVLDAYGFPVASSTVVPVGAVSEALTFQQRLDRPIVAKMIGKKLVHKSDIGGVKIDLRNGADIEKAFAEFDRAIGQHQIKADGILLQEMVKGRELVMGMHLDKDFGPLVMFGLGGVYVEVLKDISFNIAPLSLSEVQEMVESIRGYPMLTGVRGESAADFDAIHQTLLRLSQLVTDHTEIIEMDINPFMAMSEKGRSVVADARIRISNSFAKKTVIN